MCASSILISMRPNWYGTKMSPNTHHVPRAKPQHHVINPTHPGGALNYSVKDRLHVRGRATDDPEYLGRCRLILQGFAQFCVALPQFLKQPHVFDGNDRLVRKRFEEGDLLVGKRLCLHPPDGNASNRLSFTEQGSSQQGSCSRGSPAPPRLGKLI